MTGPEALQALIDGKELRRQCWFESKTIKAENITETKKVVLLCLDRQPVVSATSHVLDEMIQGFDDWEVVE